MPVGTGGHATHLFRVRGEGVIHVTWPPLPISGAPHPLPSGPYASPAPLVRVIVAVRFGRVWGQSRALSAHQFSVARPSFAT